MRQPMEETLKAALRGVKNGSCTGLLFRVSGYGVEICTFN